MDHAAIHLEAVCAAQVLSEERSSAMEELAAAWHLHVLRVEEQLISAWKEEVERMLDRRFTDLGTRIDAALESARSTARRNASERFNRAARRLARYENEEDWAAALLDATEGLSGRAIVFRLSNRSIWAVRFRGKFPGFEDVPSGVEIPLDRAPAFASAAASGDTVVSLRTAGELSAELIEALGEAADERAYVFPVGNRDRTIAFVYADSEPIDVAGFELAASIAGRAIGWHAPRLPEPDLIGITAHAESGHGAAAWSEVSKQDQELHLKAQRFARVHVAEMRLYKSNAVGSGRASQDIYSALKTDIDSGREAFQRNFIERSPSMVDYFHLELVRTLANDDVRLLGREYPGPLV